MKALQLSELENDQTENGSTKVLQWKKQKILILQIKSL